MTTWAASTFYNELDVLEIKLATLDHLIDRWVFAEASVDQRGNPKPLILADAISGDARWAPWRDKVTVVEVTDMPAGQPDDPEGVAEHWEREHFQRNALVRGLDLMDDNDRVLISDLDEIPYPAALEAALGYPYDVRFPMDMHVYRLNWRWAERPCKDGATAVVKFGHAVRRYGVHAALLEDQAYWRTDAEGKHLSSGWHLAYMGAADAIRRKALAIADNAWKQLVPDEKKSDPSFWTADPRAPTDELLERCIATGCDVFGRDYRQAEWVGLDQLPPCIAANPGRFADLLAGRP